MDEKPTIIEKKIAFKPPGGTIPQTNSRGGCPPPSPGDRHPCVYRSFLSPYLYACLVCLFLGLGYADVENRVPCHPNTVMRIASISKAITMAVVAKLWEAQKLDLDKPVTEYVKNWPEKDFKGEKVAIEITEVVISQGDLGRSENPNIYLPVVYTIISSQKKNKIIPIEYINS